MLPLPNIEELNEHLLQLPRIVDAYEARDVPIIELVKAWLKRAEDILLSNRLPEAASIATLRGTLIAAERGSLSGGPAGATGPSPRRAREAAAVDALRQAESRITALMHDDLSQIREAERVLRQIVSVARFKGHFAPDAVNGAGTSYPALVAHLWKQLSGDTDLAQGLVRVASLVGPANSLALFERQLSSQSRESG